LRRCGSCGLTFADPLDLQDTPQGLFARAYSGRESRASMAMFRHRLVWRADLLSAGAGIEQVLPRTQRRALEYIEQVSGRPAAVLDIGCGSGLFPEAASGGHVSLREVAGNRPLPASAGYRVFHGTVEEVPEGWADPEVCTAFYVIHHVTDPMRFLETIRRKFPRAHLVLTEHYLGEQPRKIAPMNLPRRLTLWTRESLRVALSNAGYEVEEISLVPHPPFHSALDGLLTRLYCTARVAIPAPMRPRLIASYLKTQEAASALLRRIIPGNPNAAQQHLLALSAAGAAVPNMSRSAMCSAVLGLPRLPHDAAPLLAATSAFPSGYGALPGFDRIWYSCAAAGRIADGVIRSPMTNGLTALPPPGRPC
jgi:SAM-dependent methyltransferase